MLNLHPHMRRMFLPVGHGAFYCERFNLGDGIPEINVVYDCGTMSGRKVLKKQIEKVFPSGSHIHAVFLSHMHVDHVSGLEMLLTKYQVDKVYFPEIEDVDKTLMDIWFQTTGQSGTFAHAFLMDAAGTIRDGVQKRDFRYSPQLIPVPATRLSADGSRVLGGGVTLTLAELVENDQRVPQEAFDGWRFVAFNFADSDVMDALKDKLKSIVNPVTNENLKAKWKEQGGAIRAIYRTIPGNNLNANSMTLFSGACGGNLKQIVDFPLSFNQYYKCLIDKMTASGCLYTGDFNACKRWKNVKAAYAAYWNSIGCIQIPHHGADVDFSDEIPEMNAFFVVSAKNGDTLHPGEHVRTTFEDCKKRIDCVTEIESSEIKYRILRKYRAFYEQLMRRLTGYILLKTKPFFVHLENLWRGQGEE